MPRQKIKNQDTTTLPLLPETQNTEKTTKTATKQKKTAQKKEASPKREIKGGGKVFVIWGDDKFLINKKVETFNLLINPLFKDFNLNVCDDIKEGLITAMSAPFGDKNRVVIVNSSIKADDLDDFERFLPLPETSTLVLVSDTKPDERTKAVKLIKACGEIFGYELIPSWKEDDIHKHILSVARHLQIKISSEAAFALVGILGSDTYRIVSELEKMSTYKDGEEITESDIKEMLPNISGNIFKCMSAMAIGDTESAINLADALFSANEHPLKLHAAIVSTVRTWLFVKELLGKADNTEIARESGIGNPQRIYFLSQEVRNIKINWIVECLIRLSELEFKLKRGGGELDFKVFISEMSNFS